MKNKFYHHLVTKSTQVILCAMLGFSIIVVAPLKAQETKSKGTPVAEVEANTKSQSKRLQLFNLLQKIKIPRFETENASLETVLNFLRTRIREHSKANVNIIIKKELLKDVNYPTDNGKGNNYKFSLKIHDGNALSLLQAIIEVESGIEFSITDNGVVLRQASSSARKVPMANLTFEKATLDDVIKAMELAGVGSQNPVNIFCTTPNLRKSIVPDFSIKGATVRGCAKLTSILMSDGANKVELVDLDGNSIAFRAVSNNSPEKDTKIEAHILSLRFLLAGKSKQEQSTIMEREVKSLLELCQLAQPNSSAKGKIHLGSGSVILIGNERDKKIGKEYLDSLRSDK